VRRLLDVHPEVPPHPRPPALDLTGIPDSPIVVTDEVRLRLDRRHDERHVGLGERVAELLLPPAQQVGHLRIATRRRIVGDRIRVELDEAPIERRVG